MAGEIIYQFSPVSLFGSARNRGISDVLRSRHRPQAGELGRLRYRYNGRDVLLPNVAGLKRKHIEELNGSAEARCFGLRAGIADIATLRTIREK
jgi:uncharacterized membrane protein YfhO